MEVSQIKPPHIYTGIDDQVPLVFMVHGFRGHPAEFDPLVSFLENIGLATHRVCLPQHGDAPGDVAYTSWEEMLYQCELDLDKCKKHYKNIHLVGFSLGGALSLMLAQRNHHAFCSVTLAASPYKPVFNLEYGQYHLRYFFNRFLPGIMYHEWDTGLPKPVFSPYLLPKFYRQMELFFDEVQQSARKLNLSTLLIHSPYDLTIPYEHSEWLYNVIPSEPRMVTLPRGGHQIFPYQVQGLVEQSIFKHVICNSSIYCKT